MLIRREIHYGTYFTDHMEDLASGETFYGLGTIEHPLTSLESVTPPGVYKLGDLSELEPRVILRASIPTAKTD